VLFRAIATHAANDLVIQRCDHPRVLTIVETAMLVNKALLDLLTEVW